MPKLGESVTEGTINSWLVKVGDKVNKYDPIAEVMRDKVNAEVPSSYSGVIKEIVREEGDTILVGELICYIETENNQETNESSVNVIEQVDEATNVDQATNIESNNMRARYSPAVLKLASEHHIDLNNVKGTGLGGRITRKDIYQYIQSIETNVAKEGENKPVTSSVKT